MTGVTRVGAWMFCAALVASVAGCGDGTTTASREPTTSSSGAPGGSTVGKPDALPRLDAAHVHGLGTDPADGTVLAGTHDGLYRLSGGSATRVADRQQDFMGFTVLGPKRFLASGHPGPDQDLPNPVGLLETTDGGRTWTTLALAGQADFHTLAAAGDTVYGYANGRLAASEDGGRTWQPRSATNVASLAVDADSTDTLLATTEGGLVRSTDGGRTVTPVPDAPALFLLSWPAADVLVGTTADGIVSVSADGGTTWQERGRLGGQPEALYAEPDGTVLAAVAGRIVRSEDGGRSFVAVTA